MLLPSPGLLEARSFLRKNVRRKPPFAATQSLIATRAPGGKLPPRQPNAASIILLHHISSWNKLSLKNARQNDPLDTITVFNRLDTSKDASPQVISEPMLGIDEPEEACKTLEVGF